jgi:CO/xanthine dehydrogenase FAD-binding subunit
MTLTLQSFQSVPDAAHALKSPGTRYLGGGTLVVRATNEGETATHRLIRATDPALRTIEVSETRIRLGASVTMSAIAGHPALTSIAPAARAVGGPAVRNMATVGGNLFAESPYGDFATALLALDAQVGIGGAIQSIETFLHGRATLAPGTIVTAITFAPVTTNTFRFLKIARVKPKGIAVLTIAAVLTLAADGTVATARIALGSIAAHPIRAHTAEAALIGHPLTRTGIAAAVAAIHDGTDPPTDAIASAWYRREVLPVHVARLLLA